MKLQEKGSNKNVIRKTKKFNEEQKRGEEQQMNWEIKF